MAFDDKTRNRLKEFVSSARRLLTEDFTRQLQNLYGMDPKSGEISDMSRLKHLDPTARETAEILRSTLEHYRATSAAATNAELLDRIVREQAFTILNRLCAIRLAEARDIVIESIARGYQSNGPQLYARVAKTALGDTAATYRAYLLSVFDELAVDLPILFYRYSPQGRLFPTEQALSSLLDLINDSDLAALWVEDETIGWIYQYFNSVEERKKMRDESSAPRNSREMAVRNQFFTPRYVVEFLTDNTLGRTWYEMRKGKTALVDQCRYFVRRPSEVFLDEGQQPPAQEDDTSNLTQEELWKRPVYTLHRGQKDPRDIKVLDPAMGSGHFLLYAFDLLETIYREAWDQDLTTPSDVTGRTVREEYPTEEALRRAVPELILRHNLHGVDIDPRAVQIAGLALWLRAQKGWQAAGVKPVDRLSIRKSNLVVAEPMPGEADLLDEFLKDLKPALLGRLVRQVFESMKLAGEAGTLLRVEDEFQQEIEKARREWQVLQKQEKEGARSSTLIDMFSGAAPEQLEMNLRQSELMEVTGERFWRDTEERVLALLKEYSEKAENGTGRRRRLFAEDAAKGFAFIDLCRTKFDVVVMNPPFGDTSAPSKPYIDETYGDTKGDVYKAFVECFQDRLVPIGMLGIISSRTGFFLGKGEDWRTRIVLRLFRPLVIADLGFGVLEAMVETAAYTLRSLSASEDRALTEEHLRNLSTVSLDARNSFSIPQYLALRDGDMKRHQALKEIERLERIGALSRDAESLHRRFIRHYISKPVSSSLNREEDSHIVCIRLLHSEKKDKELKEATSGSSVGNTFIRNVRLFRKLPNSSFAYWVPPSFLSVFDRFPPFETKERLVRSGGETGNDERFVRARHEVDSNQLVRDDTWSWVPYAKGGAAVPFWNPPTLCVPWNWKLETFHGYTGLKHRPSLKPSSADLFFRPGITWPLRAARFCPQILPSGAAFSRRGYAVIAPREKLPVLIAATATNLFDYIFKTSLGREGFPEFVVGVLQQLPFPISFDTMHELKTIGERLVALSMEASSIGELDPLFSRLLDRGTAPTLAEATANIEDLLAVRSDEIRLLLSDAENHVAVAYGISKEDLLALNLLTKGERIEDSFGDELNDDKELESTSYDARSVHSYSIGIAFGRWDIRFATNEKVPSPLPDPFDPLPVCPPGMLKKSSMVGGLAKEENLPAARMMDVPLSYPVDIPWDGILVDDPGHGRDIVARLKRVFEVIWGEAADDRLREAAELLGQKEGDMRPWLRKEFFPFHLQRYSKSRRKAPIYWPLSTSSGVYTVWIYYQRLTDQTLLTIVNDFVEPKIAQSIELANSLRNRRDRTKKQEQELEDSVSMEHELKDFREELLRIAKFWKPNLNDGVQITAAPLWKLFQHKPWQKILKETWESLEEGEYDWAHLAYSIWPDRVREKCRTDKSLAIAHGLEDVYAESPANAKKVKGKKKKGVEQEETDGDDAN